jgi:hypothetical protein
MSPGEEQIIGTLREQEAGRRRRTFVANTGSVAPPSTNGRPSMAAPKCLMPSAPEGVGERERQAKQVAGRGDARQRHAEGCCGELVGARPTANALFGRA